MKTTVTIGGVSPNIKPGSLGSRRGGEGRGGGILLSPYSQYQVQ